MLRKINNKALKRRITTAFELPKDIMLDLPSVAMVGDEELTVSNHKGIAGYTDGQVRIKTSIGEVKVLGDGLTLREINKENIVVEGKIREIVMC